MQFMVSVILIFQNHFLEFSEIFNEKTTFEEFEEICEQIHKE